MTHFIMPFSQFYCYVFLRSKRFLQCPFSNIVNLCSSLGAKDQDPPTSLQNGSTIIFLKWRFENTANFQNSITKNRITLYSY
jgi:hypothetical protein